MRRLFKNFREAKQVGNLYHFTTFTRGIDVVNGNCLNANEKLEIFPMPTVSMTRNKFYFKLYPKGDSLSQVVFCFDGDKLSEKYKIFPYCWSWSMDSFDDMYNKIKLKLGKDSNIDPDDIETLGIEYTSRNFFGKKNKRSYLHNSRKECEERVVLHDGKLNNVKLYCKKILLVRDNFLQNFHGKNQEKYVMQQIGLQGTSGIFENLYEVAEWFFNRSGFKVVGI